MPEWKLPEYLVFFLGFLSAFSGCMASSPFSQPQEERMPALEWDGVAVVSAAKGGSGAPLYLSRLDGPYPPFLPFGLFQVLINAKAEVYRDGSLSNPDFAEHVVPFVYCAEFGISRVLGTTEAFLQMKTKGHPIALKKGHWAAGKGEVVIGHSLAERESVQLGESFLVQPWTSASPGGSPLLPVALKVTGMLGPQGNAWDRGMFTNLTVASDILSRGDVWNKGVLHYIAVQVREGGLEDLRTVVQREAGGRAVVHSASEGSEKAIPMWLNGLAGGLLLTVLSWVTIWYSNRASIPWKKVRTMPLEGDMNNQAG